MPRVADVAQFYRQHFEMLIQIQVFVLSIEVAQLVGGANQYV
jgi:hypothetical protein